MGDNNAYDYEFLFNDTFDMDVYNQYPIPDTDNTLLKIVTDKVESLTTMLRLQPGIHILSTFAMHDDQRLKITVLNTTWINPNNPWW